MFLKILPTVWIDLEVDILKSRNKRIYIHVMFAHNGKFLPIKKLVLN
jgi:hypothetical protein